MSLRKNLEDMNAAMDTGKYQEWLMGKWNPPRGHWPLDPSAAGKSSSMTQFLRERGE